MDPLFFKNGFQLVWRIGDIDDAAGLKCMMLTGTNIAGSPQPTQVTAYAWVYTWDEAESGTTPPTTLSSVVKDSSSQGTGSTVTQGTGTAPSQSTTTKGNNAIRTSFNYAILVAILMFLIN